MSVQEFTPAAGGKAAVTLTDAAAQHLRQQLAKSGQAGVRLSLRQAGCTGYKYQIDEVQAAVDGDLTLHPAAGVTLFVDRTHLTAFDGLEIDYVVNGLNHQLILNNPNVKDECGCGESFNV